MGRSSRAGRRLWVAGAVVVLAGTVAATPPARTRRRDTSPPPAADLPARSVPERPKAAPTPLDGTRWQLQSYRNSEGENVTPLEGGIPTARFRAGRIITGSTGCGTFIAGYTYDAGNLTVSKPAASAVGCARPLLEQEAAYLAALHFVAGFTLSDDALVLTDVRGAALLTYQREPPPVLSGTEWRMTGYDDGKSGFTPALGHTAVGATFGTDGWLAGSAGCNAYRGKYSQAGDKLTIGPLILMTRKACPEPTRDQERAYLIALRSATRAELAGQQLRLMRPGDARAVEFIAAPAPSP